jgi:carbamoyltransferase
MKILGLNYFYHDSTACVVVDGKLKVAIEEERLTRVKHTHAFPYHSIKRCLVKAGLTSEDIDVIAVSIKPTLHWGSKAAYAIRHFTKDKPFLIHEVLHARSRQREFWHWLRQTWPKEKERPKVHMVPHHLAHIAGSFVVSPYDKAALLSLDGSGEWSTSFLGYGEGNSLTCFNESFFPHSLGSFYEAVTEFCGFRPNYDEGKTMGLAPFGNSATFHEAASKIINLSDEGAIQIDLSYFDYQYWGNTRCGKKFYDTFGSPRKNNEPFEMHHEDTAAAFQRVLEETALKLCRILKDKTHAQHLVIAGGVGLNSVMNGRIVRESDFDDIYVMPAAGDNGTAIGAAYYVHNVLLGQPRTYVHDNPYVGTVYSQDDIDQVIAECKLKAERYSDIAPVAAKLLHEGNIIGWFQGAMEIGPRALGNRSILADPTQKGMKDKINAEVKHREAYRPFAPSVTVEVMKDYFESDVEAPFMLKVCDVRHDMRDKLPAITHVDGTARMQTVRKDINPLYHSLLNEFGKLSGVPVLLNTSFNIMGEPIVESPIDAIRCFFSTGLDKLVIGNCVISK